MRRAVGLVQVLLLTVAFAFSATPAPRLNPAIQQIVDSVSQDRIAATLHRLESFGTRYVLSAQDDPEHGIGAAKRWVHDQFQSYSPRLQVSYQPFTVAKGARQGQILRDVQLDNVVAVLPGAMDKDEYVLVTGHYDSVVTIRKHFVNQDEAVADALKRGVAESEERKYLQRIPLDEIAGPVNGEATAAQESAPGVTDDGSGTAAVLELARVMSQHQFDKTIVFIAFSAEEIGLSGSQAYASMAKEKGTHIEAVLNNDIIGSEVAGNGRTNNSELRVFANGPEDSPSRQLLRYTKEIAERYVPSMHVEMVFRGDRFLRGGDQTPFVNAGFAAVRLTTPNENYENQHTATDTFENTSVPYTTRVAKMNAAVLSSLALAPAPPTLNWTWNSGPNKGGHVPLLTRGKSGYDAVLRWYPNAEPDLAGYTVLMRSTTSATWESELWVGNVTTYTFPNVSIDDVVFGVRAVDREGNASMVSAYLEPVLPSQITRPVSGSK